MNRRQKRAKNKRYQARKNQIQKLLKMGGDVHVRVFDAIYRTLEVENHYTLRDLFHVMLDNNAVPDRGFVEVVGCNGQVIIQVYKSSDDYLTQNASGVGNLNTFRQSYEKNLQNKQLLEQQNKSKAISVLFGYENSYLPLADKDRKKLRELKFFNFIDPAYQAKEAA